MNFCFNRIDELSFSPENQIINSKTGQSVGKLINLIDQDGIAMLRLANLDKKYMVLVDNNKKNVQISVDVPKYWPVNEDSLVELKRFISS
jgi:hypothetical protein